MRPLPALIPILASALFIVSCGPETPPSEGSNGNAPAAEEEKDPGAGEASGFTFAEPGGFRIRKIASSREAHDIHCMTLDGSGEVVVSGPGYIRRLTDGDGDGYLETVQEVYKGPVSGAQALLFVDDLLYFVGGRGLERLEDRDGDGRADGPATLVLPIRTGGEHHAHGIRRGADGMFYWILGNHSGLETSRIRGGPPSVPEPYAGLFVRLSPDARTVEVIAHGLRNAYDFDFLPNGEVIGWDSDGERDEGLPWYRPCRLYHLTEGADCGWRSSRSGKLATHCFDTIMPAAEVGRGSPTGVACYAHRTFPAKYRGGIFALDWTFGRIVFFPPREHGGTYRGPFETFLSASGQTAFAPTDIVVSPDGAILVSSGGRGHSGAVFRIEATEPAESVAAGESPASLSLLDRVLDAPVPLAEWSRQRWLPLARRLESGALREAVLGESRTVHARIRALDVLAELHPETVFETLHALVENPDSRPADLLARAAWWSSRLGLESVPRALLHDRRPLVARAAVDSARRFLGRGRPVLLAGILSLADHPSRRVRQAVAYALVNIPLEKIPLDGQTSIRGLIATAGAVVLNLRGRDFPARVVSALAERLPKLRSDLPGTREDLLDLLRLLELAYAYRSEHNPGEDFFVAWGILSHETHREAFDAGHLWRDLEALIESTDLEVSRQSARLSALLKLSEAASVDAILGRIRDTSGPGEDVLTLSLLSRFDRPFGDEVSERIVDAAIDLPFKVERSGQGRDRRWHSYVQSAWSRLVRNHDSLKDLLFRHERFGHPDHIALVRALDRDARQRAALVFAARRLPEDATARREVASLVLSAPDGEAKRAFFVRLVDDPVARRYALSALSENPRPGDRELFRTTLARLDRQEVHAAVQGLLNLPISGDNSDVSDADTEPDIDDARVDEILDLLRWGLRSDRDPTMVATRDLIARQLARLSPESVAYEENFKGSQKESFLAWGEILARAAEPGLAEMISRALDELQSDEKRLAEVLTKADWDSGDPRRGKEVYHRLNCGSCHEIGGKGTRVGPNLEGVAKRFSIPELVEAIALPNRQVADRYLTETFVLKSGERIEAIALYDQREALQLKTRDGQELRLTYADVEMRLPQSLSLMPTGFLDSVNVQDVADLVSFLRIDGKVDG